MNKWQRFCVGLVEFTLFFTAMALIGSGLGLVVGWLVNTGV